MREIRAPFVAEMQVDTAYEQGHFDYGKELLALARLSFDPSNSEYIASEHFFHLKEIATPFYIARHELHTEGEISPQTLRETEDVHAYAVEAIRDDIKKRQDADKEQKPIYTGAITEKVIFALGARSFNLYQRRFMVPSTAMANISRRNPSDFDVITLPHHSNNYTVDIRPIQVKTNAEAPHNIKATKKSSIPVVGLRQIDPQGPMFPNKEGDEVSGEEIHQASANYYARSLPTLMIRDIDGTATTGEVFRIDEATHQMYDAIYGSAEK